MSTENEFRLAIEQIQKYSNELGYQTNYLGKRDEENDDVEDIEILLPESSLYITGRPNMKYFQASTSYDYIESVSESIKKESIQRDLLSDKEEQLETDKNVNNVQYVAQEMVREAEFTELLSDGLSLFVNTDRVYLISEEKDKIGFSGFSVNASIFPFEADFSIRRLDRSIDSIIMAVRRGHAYLRLASSVQEPDQTESGHYELVVEPGWHTNWQ
jgi:hypothetical protein